MGIGPTDRVGDSTEAGSRRVPGADAVPAGRNAIGPAGVTTSDDASRHEPRTVGADKRVWLEAVYDEAATMRLHGFCTDCGAVRSRLPMRGRPMGYFAQALANLKAILEDHPKYRKLAQVHSHLIQKALEAVPDFEDPYPMPFETQWSIFLHAVQRYRPELDVDFIRSALPREPRRVMPAFLDLVINRTKEAGEQISD